MSIHLFTQIAQYKMWLYHKGIMPQTIHNYEDKVTRILGYFEEVGITEVNDITTDVIPIIETWLLDRGLGYGSRRAYLVVFKSFLSYLKQSNLIMFDIGLKIRMPKVFIKMRKVLSVDEVKELLALPDKTTEKGMRDYLILSLLYITGVRAGELSKIMVSDLDFRQRSIFIEGKGGHERRVFFTVELATDLKKFIEAHCDHILFPEVSSHKVSKLATKYLEKAGLDSTGAHTFRFTIATHMFERGVNPRLIQTMLGHKYLRETFYYIRPDTDYLKSLHTQYHPFQRGFL